MARRVKKPNSNNTGKGGNKDANKRNSRDTKGSSSGTNSSSGSSSDGLQSGTSGSNGDVEQKDKSEGDDDVTRKSKVNDPEWYARDAQLLVDSSSLNYSDPFGKPVSLLPYNTTLSNSVKTGAGYWSYAIAGLNVLTMKHTIGYSTNRNDAPNVAADALYTHVRYVNSGRKNYDPCDLFMYVMAISELHAFIQWCKRCYAFAFLYSQRNVYIGKELLESSGVNSVNVLNNLANFRYWVNTFVNKIASFAIPKNIPYVSRKKFMYDGLYLENPYENLKDQLYMYNPEGFYKFQLDADGKGMLKWVELTTKVQDGSHLPLSTKLTVSDIMSYGNNLLANIMGDEDFGLMSGDILKAFNAEIESIDGLPSEYYILPRYDIYVLSQFKNSTVIETQRGLNVAVTYHSPNDTGSALPSYEPGNVYQDQKGLIQCREVGSSYNAASSLTLLMDKILSVESPTPGPSDNIEATRCTVSAIMIDHTVETEYSSDCLLAYTGVDYPVMESMITFQDNHIGAINNKYQNVLSYSVIARQNFTPEQLTTMLAFKYSPIKYMYEYQTDSSDNRRVIDTLSCISNIDNYTIINAYVLLKMHECALLSLFYVPGVAKVVNYLK